MAPGPRRPSAYEKPFGGFPRPGKPDEVRTLERGIVKGVDTKNRTANIAWTTKSGGPFNVKIWSDIGDYSLPEENDEVICMIDAAKQPMIVGYCDINLPTRLEGFQIPEALHGERLWFAKRFGQRLHFRRDGSIQLLTNRDEGLEVVPQQRVRMRAPDLWEIITNAGKISYGTVRRRIGGGVPTTPSDDSPVLNPLQLGKAHVEWTVDVKFFPTSPPVAPAGRAARLSFGTGVIDDKGKPEKSAFGSLLRGIIEIQGMTGGLVSLAHIQMDEIGNVEIKALKTARMRGLMAEVIGLVKTIVKGAQVEIGILPIEAPILGNLFMSLYNPHFHMVPQAPAGVLPSGPPIPQAGAALSRTIKISP